ncbi:MAG: DUF4198 domain-containing protein [Sphingomonadaceae bacterium]
MNIRTIFAMAGLALPLLAVVATPAEAHRRWLLPSATVLAGEEETVSVDGAISNELFYFDHHAAGLEDLKITGPDGNEVAPAIIGSGKYRSVFDVPLKQQGTYRIALVSDGAMGFYQLNGERGRVRGKNIAEVQAGLPAGAQNARLIPVSSRVETFVTLGEPSDTVLAPTGNGLEMVVSTHPNDIVAGEPIQVRFLNNGVAVSGLTIEFTAGGTRYRDNAGTEELTTDNDGMVTLTAKNAGPYYIEASTGDSSPAASDAEAEASAGPVITAPRYSYAAVLEFLPG